jgi:hypothetical protein
MSKSHRRLTMALLGQASGGFTESSSALRILHVGVRNTVGQLTEDSFTQTNPPIETTAARVSTSAGLLTNALGVLSGSIAFARPDEGANYHGGPSARGAAGDRVLGVFINNASGNAFENQPGVASNRGPYVSAQGTYANRLYETSRTDANVALTYTIGESLFASVNGYLTNDTNERAADTTVIGVLKISPDSSSDELVYDQRI